MSQDMLCDTVPGGDWNKHLTLDLREVMTEQSNSKSQFQLGRPRSFIGVTGTWVSGSLWNRNDPVMETWASCTTRRQPHRLESTL